jgi:F-type H+-transporting ATPase subunit epsilon
MSLRIIVVTPEKAVLDEAADSVVLPMFDGERGVLTGHAAFVGQLAPGELKITTGTTVKRFYIDSGFVQVANNTVNVLTAKSLASDKVTADVVAKARTEAEALPSTTAIERENRTKALARVSGMAKVASAA